MRRALGKGLSQLLGEQAEAAAPAGTLPVEAIQANRQQPRTQFDEGMLAELADSIREHGILQPLLVRPIAEGRYELIAGERRLRAAKIAGLAEVPVIIRSAGNQNSLELALIENVQREDISAMECARAYKRLADEFGLSQEQIAQKVGKSRAAIANTIRLTRLPEVIQQAVELGELSEGHARALLSVETPALQHRLFKKALADGLSVREMERLAKKKEPSPQPGGRATPQAPKPTHSDPAYGAVEEALSVYFGSPVKLVRSETGGAIRIDFYSDEDLDRLLEVLGVRV